MGAMAARAVSAVLAEAAAQPAWVNFRADGGVGCGGSAYKDGGRGGNGGPGGGGARGGDGGGGAGGPSIALFRSNSPIVTEDTTLAFGAGGAGGPGGDGLASTQGARRSPRRPTGSRSPGSPRLTKGEGPALLRALRR